MSAFFGVYWYQYSGQITGIISLSIAKEKCYLGDVSPRRFSAMGQRRGR